ncbi:MAG: helix-turn-helix transcriptional regulator, partial [Desulfatitalea sp.]|nr:helix-turn-helix transcriptional regulator [Desulfatitalea sp.]NNK01731.1 helix-turn-helix transcriptional regulator [Desulfatitalea sp.]
DYVESHLDDDLTLSSLARVAHFSPFHFHRIFSAVVGESLNRFIQRVRVEKAASQLLLNPKKSITEIALDCGFSSAATFARAFREAFQMKNGSPSQIEVKQI